MTVRTLPKIIGADVELSNYIEGTDGGNTGHIASRMLLKHVDGTAGSAYGPNYAENPQDIGRKWLVNGSCCYIDLDHLETCLPEVTTAWDFCASFHAQLRIVRAARALAADRLRPEFSLHVAVCNSDGNDGSWGCHLNFLMSRFGFDAIFKNRIHCLLWLASYHASSVLIHGMGKVGAENGSPETGYQISQRADFIEEVLGLQTTYCRPIINCRDEPLCGADPDRARFHHIACDANLCHVANVLKVGILQILLCMIEREAPQIRPEVVLLDPVEACHAFSRSLNMSEARPTWAGRRLNALELQRRYFDAVSEFVESGGCDGLVPKAREIVRLWSEVLENFVERDWTALARKLDWVLKYQVLRGVIEENPELSWSSPEIKRLHLSYGSLDPEEGFYWSLEQTGYVDLLVSERRIDRFVHYPPSETRAYARGRLIQAFHKSEVLEVNWDVVRIRAQQNHGFNEQSRAVRLNNPLEFGRERTGPVFRRLARDEVTRAEALDELAVPLENTRVAHPSPAVGATKKTSYSLWPKKPDSDRYSFWR